MALNDSLLKFQVYDELLGDVDQQSPSFKKRQQQSLFYLIGVIMAELTLTLTSFLYLQAFKIQYLLIFGCAWVFLWSLIGKKQNYMRQSQFLFWIESILQSSMFLMSLLIGEYHFILCGCGTITVLFIILELIWVKRVNTSKIYIYLYIWYGIIYYNDVKRISYDINFVLVIPLIIYFLLMTVILIILYKRFDQLSRFAKFQVVCLVYPLSVLFVFCLCGIVPQFSFKYNWSYFTIANHLAFLLILYYSFKNSKIFHVFKRQDVLNEQQKRQLLYQNSDTRLISQQDHMANIRESMQGSPPLAPCTFCQTDQSSFCYMNCKHAVVCINCAEQWLKNLQMKKCPFCRAESSYLLHIQRISGIVFAINGKFKFQAI